MINKFSDQFEVGELRWAYQIEAEGVDLFLLALEFRPVDPNISAHLVTLKLLRSISAK